MKILTLKDLEEQKKITPPKWLVSNMHYLTIMGSNAYGCSTNSSDLDMYGWCMPPKEVIFPHLTGEIDGFGTPGERFKQWQEHHVKTDEIEYDFTVYGITRYFQLCMECNPNMIDSLFTPLTCVKTCSPIGQKVKESRHLFLSKKAYHSFKGYAYSQKNKIDVKNSLVNKVADIESKYSIKISDLDEKEIEDEIQKRNLKI